MGIWNRNMELISRDELDQIKIERLQAVLNRAMDNVPFYHDMFSMNSIMIIKKSFISTRRAKRSVTEKGYSEIWSMHLFKQRIT